MASTGAVLYVRPRMEATEVPGRITGAILYVPVRLVSGLFTTGVTASRDLSNLRAFLPHINEDFLNGSKVSPRWYRFFQYFVDVFQAGAGVYTFQDLIDAIDSAVAQSASQAARTEAVAAQSQTNAEALSAVVQVAQNSALPGSEQIPPVQLSNQEMIP